MSSEGQKPESMSPQETKAEAEKRESLQQYIASLEQEIARNPHPDFLRAQDVYTHMHELHELSQQDAQIITKNGETRPLSTDILKKSLKFLEIIDEKTGAKKRDAQNDFLRDAIAERAENLQERGSEVCFFNIDVRGLKVVNDANGSHEMGDLYLKEITTTIQEQIIPQLISFFNKAGITLTSENFSFSRDGGDEFSLAIKALGVNFDEEDGIENEPLHQYLGEYIATIFKKTNMSHILTRETIDRHINRSAEPGKHIQIPEGFVFPSNIAIGSTTLTEVLTEPDTADCKNMHEPIRENSPDALNRVLGMLRSRSDRNAYQNKLEMDARLLESPDVREKFLLTIYARNEFTMKLIQEREKLEQAFLLAQEKMQELAQQLSDCQSKQQ